MVKMVKQIFQLVPKYVFLWAKMVKKWSHEHWAHGIHRLSGVTEVKSFARQAVENVLLQSREVLDQRTGEMKVV